VRTGSVWTEQQKLRPDEPGVQGSFGESVALAGNTSLVGDPGADCGAGLMRCGIAYVFVRSGTVWSVQQKLLPGDQADEDDQVYGDAFGDSVSLSGDTALVGAPDDGCPAVGQHCGAAYVFVRSGVTWSEQQKLVDEEQGPSDRFADVVAVKGQIAVVGATQPCAVPGYGCGAAHVFDRTATTWAERQTLVADEGIPNASSVTDLAISGSAVVSGVYGGCDSGNNCGAAYVYDPPDPIFADGFASGDLSAWSASATDGGDLSVSIDGGMAPLDNGFNYGLQAFVNDRNALYVEDQAPDNELRYRVKFFVDPHTFDPGEAGGRFRVRILLGFDIDPTLRRQFAVVLRRIGGQYSLMVRTTRANGTRANTSFFPLTPGPHSIELDWQRAGAAGVADGTMTLWIDDELKQVVSGLDTGLYGIDQVRLGPTSIKQGANGILYFDRFESRRFGQIP
jgi:hypothetical protein